MNRRDAIKLSALGTGALISNPLNILASAKSPNPIQHSLLTQTAFSSPFSKSDFGDDFKWGVATAAYQIEGAWQADGKSPSVWDAFTHKKGKIKNNENADVSCDFYHNYASDLAILKSLNFKVFRFSLAWTRIMPDGTGKINQKGFDFYHQVIDECLKLGLEPWITLYHWDLPQVLEDKGGWANREVIGWFSDYVDACTKEFGSKVKNWMVFNEPMAFVPLGYMLGIHAPGKKSIKKFMKGTHHVCMCQAAGGRIIRQNVPDAHIGTTFSCSHVDPKNQKPKHLKAARTIDAMFNRLFIEPALGLGYPWEDVPFLKRIKKYIQPGDEEKLAFDFDFIGLQNYSRIIATHSLIPPLVWANQVSPKKRGIPKEDLTLMGWEVYPEGIYKLMKQFDAYEGIDKIIITENGAAFTDIVQKNDTIKDDKRIQFFKDYLSNVLKAKQEGVNIQGYFVWTFLDNFEWAEGYHPRFGLVHVDFKTQQRRIKNSGLWFKELLSE